MRAQLATILHCALLSLCLAGSGAAWAARSQGPVPVAGHWHAGEYLSAIVPLGDDRRVNATPLVRATITNPLTSVDGGTVAMAGSLGTADRQASYLISLVAALSVFSSSTLGLAELGRRKPARRARRYSSRIPASRTSVA